MSDFMIRGAIVIFARAPRFGEVKTRLIDAKIGQRVLSPQDAALLYRAMLQDSILLANRAAQILNQKGELVDVILAYTPNNAFEVNIVSRAASLRNYWNGATWPQINGDLGKNLTVCFAAMRARGYSKIIVIGSDAPDIPISFLLDAFISLKPNALVFGPAQDGGFYLIGTSGGFPATLLQNITWSSSQVLKTALQNARRLHQNPSLLDVWRDVDELEDLLDLIRRLEKSSHESSMRSDANYTRQILIEWGLLKDGL